MKLYLSLISIVILLFSVAIGCAQTETTIVSSSPGHGDTMSGMTCKCPMCEGMKMMGGQKSHDQMLAHLKAIGLSDDQMQRLLNIFLDFAKTQARLSGEVKVAQIEVAQKFLQDNVDRKQVENQIQQISRLQGDMQLAGIRALLDAREVLTPAQRKQLISMLLGGAHTQMPMGTPAPPQPPPVQH